jgi:hypothetical protein
MKPIPRTQHLIEYTQGKYFQYFQETNGDGVNYPMFGYPEFLLYDNRLKEYGFTDYAIAEAKSILGLESFGDISMLVFMETTAKNCPSIMDFNGILSSKALLLTKIEGRSNDPYAIFDMLINTFNTYQELNQLGTLDHMYDYLEKWRLEYWLILGKNFYLDYFSYLSLYLSIFIFDRQFGLNLIEKETFSVHSIDPFFFHLPYILCESNSILRTHRYFQDKLKLELKNPGFDNIYNHLYKYLKKEKPYPTKFIQSLEDLSNPELLRKVYDKDNDLVERERKDYLENYNKILGIKIETNIGFSKPNTIFPGITVEYYQDESGDIKGRLIGELEE